MNDDTDDGKDIRDAIGVYDRDARAFIKAYESLSFEAVHTALLYLQARVAPRNPQDCQR